MSPTSHVLVSVPCSTSNIGPGFDCLGCAFALHNTFDVRVASAPRFRFEGSEKGELGEAEGALFLGVMARVFDRAGKPMPSLAITATVRVPNSRGLGSSSTAIVGALAAANALSGARLGRQELLDMACSIEGHPDNVTPALLGGLTAAMKSDDGCVLASRFLPHRSLRFVVASPLYAVKTKAAREVLPASVPLKDAVANGSRLPLLVDALVKGRFERLRTLTEDRLHEPYRMGLYAGFAELKAAALGAGASAVTLSGAGPSMLALCTEEKAGAVARCWRGDLRKVGVPGTVRVLAVEPAGALVQRV